MGNVLLSGSFFLVGSNQLFSVTKWDEMPWLAAENWKCGKTQVDTTAQLPVCGFQMTTSRQDGSDVWWGYFGFIFALIRATGSGEALSIFIHQCHWQTVEAFLLFVMSFSLRLPLCMCLHIIHPFSRTDYPVDDGGGAGANLCWHLARFEVRPGQVTCSSLGRHIGRQISLVTHIHNYG